jgi:hypothetical protein
MSEKLNLRLPLRSKIAIYSDSGDEVFLESSRPEHCRGGVRRLKLLTSFRGRKCWRKSWRSRARYISDLIKISATIDYFRDCWEWQTDEVDDNYNSWRNARADGRRVQSSVVGLTSNPQTCKKHFDLWGFFSLMFYDEILQSIINWSNAMRKAWKN